MVFARVALRALPRTSMASTRLQTRKYAIEQRVPKTQPSPSDNMTYIYAGVGVVIAGLAYYVFADSSAEGKVKGMANEAEGKVKGMASQAEGKMNELTGKAKGQANEAVGEAKKAMK